MGTSPQCIHTYASIMRQSLSLYHIILSVSNKSQKFKLFWRFVSFESCQILVFVSPWGLVLHLSWKFRTDEIFIAMRCWPVLGKCTNMSNAPNTWCSLVGSGGQGSTQRLGRQFCYANFFCGNSGNLFALQFFPCVLQSGNFTDTGLVGPLDVWSYFILHKPFFTWPYH